MYYKLLKLQPPRSLFGLHVKSSGLSGPPVQEIIALENTQGFICSATAKTRVTLLFDTLTSRIFFVDKPK